MTFHSIATRGRTMTVRAEGVLARMIRLWLEHHQRLMDLGIHQG